MPFLTRPIVLHQGAPSWETFGHFLARRRKQQTSNCVVGVVTKHLHDVSCCVSMCGTTAVTFKRGTMSHSVTFYHIRSHSTSFRGVVVFKHLGFLRDLVGDHPHSTQPPHPFIILKAEMRKRDVTKRAAVISESRILPDPDGLIFDKESRILPDTRGFAGSHSRP